MFDATADNISNPQQQMRLDAALLEEIERAWDLAVEDLKVSIVFT